MSDLIVLTLTILGCAAYIALGFYLGNKHDEKIRRMFQSPPPALTEREIQLINTAMEDQRIRKAEDRSSGETAVYVGPIRVPRGKSLP